MTTFQGRVPEFGRCSSCSAVALLDSFRSRTDYRRYKAGNGCQQCQDVDSAGVASPDQLHWGAVVGCGTRGSKEGLESTAPEFALLPFRFAPSTGWYAWEPRLVLRFGQEFEPIDLWRELVPMSEHWQDHQVRVREFRNVDDPVLLDRLARFDLLVALHPTWLNVAVTRFSVLSRASRVSLLAVLLSSRDSLLARLRSWAWIDGMLHYVPAPDEPFSPLRTCALLAAFLERGSGPPASSVRPMDLVLRRSMAQGEAVDLEVAS